jgi:predicted phage terminase large subunit-like protein
MSDLLTREEVKGYMALVETLPSDSPEVEKVWRLLKRDKQERCRQNFLPFVREMWPPFIAGKHHQIMAEAFERVARGDLKRLIINMPPRHTKSEFASYLFPSWYLGLYPEKKVIQTAHTAELAVGFGRKVRNLVGSQEYQSVFRTKLSSDSKAAGRWNTDKGGDYFAIGVGGAVTGKGADILIIDDPHSEQEAMMGSPTVYERVFEWYSSGPRQRLQPGGSIVIVMCMTGDTNVLMADGGTRKLKDVRSGDQVATYENGRITTSRINNWRSNGVDNVFTVKTQSGNILQANERHPFLVDFSGERKWMRLKDLRPGMQLVSTRVVKGHPDQKLSQAFAIRAKHVRRTIEKILSPLTDRLEAMGCGRVCLAHNVINQQAPKGCAEVVIRNSMFHHQTQQNSAEQKESSTGTESPLSNMNAWFKREITSVTSATSHLLAKTLGRTGMANFALTTATTQERFVDFCATTATLPLDTEKPQKPLKEPLSTYVITTSQIVEIVPSGQEEVFDVEIDRTENFIANGVVSHNTRWSKKDLTGQILQSAAKKDSDEWEVIELPALMPSGKPLWPEFWKREELESIKLELPVGKWEAQYQQNPTSEEGAIIKRDMWMTWENEKPPEVDYIIQSWDTAFEKNNRADYSACTTWGVFYREVDGMEIANIIVLDAFKERMEFPELKKTAYDMWKEWNPDTLLVEKKAAGAPLIYEMRRMGIPISEYTPSKGSDKIARVNAISDLFASGMVWRPETKWADELVEEVASFPNGDHDDLVDSTSQALLRFRQGGFIQLSTDEEDKQFIPRKAAYY